MRVNHTKIKDQEQAHLRSRGVPGNLFRLAFDVNDYLTKCEWQEEEKRIVRVKVEQQRKDLLDLVSKPFRDANLIAIGTKNHEVRAQAVALALFRSACDNHHMNNSGHGIMVAPLWHTIIGGYKDSLRDQASRYSEYNRPSLLVLDNLAGNATNEKLEKTRDLLKLHPSIPRILIISGANPIDFVRNRLYMRPTHVVYLGERRMDGTA